MELTESLTALLQETVQQLTGSVRRVFLARTVRELGSDGWRRAAREVGDGHRTLLLDGDEALLERPLRMPWRIVPLTARDELPSVQSRPA